MIRTLAAVAWIPLGAAVLADPLPTPLRLAAAAILASLAGWSLVADRLEAPDA